MAAVIRDARMESERLVLAVVPSLPPASAAAAASAHARTRPLRAERAETAARIDDAAQTAAAEWPPESQAPSSSPRPLAASSSLQPAALDQPLAFDPAAEQETAQERLAAERQDVLAQAESEGFAAGQAQGSAEFAAQLEALQALIASLHTALEDGIAGAEDVIVEIAFEAVCKMLGEAMVERQGVVLAVREIVRGMREREPLLLRVSPADFEVLAAHRAQLLQGGDGKTIDLVADERVTLGGCLVETSGGTLDGRLETQLQRLVDTLSSARRMQPGEGIGSQ